jgi:DUF971 family protein
VDNCLPAQHHAAMQPVDVQVIGTELAIKWQDGCESYIPLERLRRACPCAMCQGEGNLLGRRAVPLQPPLTTASFALRALHRVGSYGLQPEWADGHATGIYPFELLRRLGQGSVESPR